jgi:hypothetical protein
MSMVGSSMKMWEYIRSLRLFSLEINSLIDWAIALRFSILHRKDIMEDLMPLYPYDILQSEGILQYREKCMDIAKAMRLESIHESIAERPLGISLSNPLIGHRKTRSHQNLIESRIVFGDQSHGFLGKDIDLSWLFGDDLYRLSKGSEKYPLPDHTRSIDFSYLVDPSEDTLRPDTIKSSSKNIEIVIGYIVEDDISSMEVVGFDLILLTQREYRGKKILFDHTRKIIQ